MRPGAELMPLLASGYQVVRAFDPLAQPTVRSLVEKRYTKMVREKRDAVWLIDAGGDSEDGSVGQGKSNLMLVVADIMQPPARRCRCALVTLQVDRPAKVWMISKTGESVLTLLFPGMIVRLKGDPDKSCIHCGGAGLIPNPSGPFDPKRQVIVGDEYGAWLRLLRELPPFSVVAWDEAQDGLGRQAGSWQRRAPMRMQMQFIRKFFLWHVWSAPTMWDLDAYLIMDRIQKRLLMEAKTKCRVFRRTSPAWMVAKRDRWGEEETVLEDIPKCRAASWDPYNVKVLARVRQKQVSAGFEVER